jgi:hypothetical protein
MVSQTIPQQPGGILNVADAADRAQVLGTLNEIELRAYGYLIFKWLLALLVFGFLLLALYAWTTFPDSTTDAASSSSALPASPSSQDAWVASIKDLGQIFLLTPIFPLIGAVIGYMFGRQQQSSPPV